MEKGYKHVKRGDEVFGLVPHGGFAEEVVAPAKSIFPKPPMMDYKVAASFMMAYGTSYHALKDRAKLKGNGNASGVGCIRRGRISSSRIG